MNHPWMVFGLFVLYTASSWWLAPSLWCRVFSVHPDRIMRLAYFALWEVFGIMWALWYLFVPPAHILRPTIVWLIYWVLSLTLGWLFRVGLWFSGYEVGHHEE